MTISSSTELSSVASPVAEAVASEPDAVEYPKRHWIAQSVWHGDGVRLATAALHHHCNDRDNVLVVMELVVYCERGNHRARLRPDVQVQSRGELQHIQGVGGRQGTGLLSWR